MRSQGGTDDQTVHVCSHCHLVKHRSVRPAAKSRRAGGAAAEAEVSGDLGHGKVTFRLSAPKASEVQVHNTTGGWAVWPEGADVAMTKDDQGVWSVTIGPLKPSSTPIRSWWTACRRSIPVTR